MANVRFIKTTKDKHINRESYDDNAIYFCQDTQEIYKGALPYTEGIKVIPTYADLPSCPTAADGVVYYVTETRNGYVMAPDRSGWLQTIYAPVANMEDVPEGEEYNVVATVGAVRDLEEELRTYVDEQVATGGGGSIDYGEIQL